MPNQYFAQHKSISTFKAYRPYFYLRYAQRRHSPTIHISICSRHGSISLIRAVPILAILSTVIFLFILNMTLCTSMNSLHHKGSKHRNKSFSISISTSINLTEFPQTRSSPRRSCDWDERGPVAVARPRQDSTRTSRGRLAVQGSREQVRRQSLQKESVLG